MRSSPPPACTRARCTETSASTPECRPEKTSSPPCPASRPERQDSAQALKSIRVPRFLSANQTARVSVPSEKAPPAPARSRERQQYKTEIASRRSAPDVRPADNLLPTP